MYRDAIDVVEVAEDEIDRLMHWPYCSLTIRRLGGDIKADFGFQVVDGLYGIRKQRPRRIWYSSSNVRHAASARASCPKRIERPCLANIFGSVEFPPLSFSLVYSFTFFKGCHQIYQ